MSATPTSQPGADIAEPSEDAAVAEAHAAASATHTLRSRAWSGTLWTVLGYGSSQVLRLGSNLVLARLLAPEHFGVMLLVNVIIQGLTMFSDIGIGPSIIHNKRGDDPVFLDTAWTLQAGRGFALWLAACVSAPLFVLAYDKPELIWLLPVAGTTALFAGFNSTKLFTLNRHMRLGRRTLVDLGAQAVGVVAMLAWAFVDRSVWALVAGGVANSAAKMVLSHVALAGHGNRLRLEADARRELFTFGKWIFVSTLITFFAMQIDRLLLPVFMRSDDDLGVYGIALTLATLPPMVAAMLAGTVVYPLLAAQARESVAALEQGLARVRSWFLPCATFASLAFVLCAPAFFDTLYDSRYREAGWIAQALTLPYWFALLTNSADRALLAVGDTQALAVGNLVSLVGKIVGGALGYLAGGLLGFILGMGLGSLAGHVVIQRALARRGISIWKQDVVSTLRVAALAAVGLLVPRWLGPNDGSIVQRALELAVAAVLLAPLGWALIVRLRREFVRS